ncbi:hypothetical protein [Hyella patelloides]|uniref:hypothetical protein n=1 Tax=Hyella patelloides TaxID=1982969 RepID=UPI001C949E3E|nr:hypothetical protein [Hyella patelloides]
MPLLFLLGGAKSSVGSNSRNLFLEGNISLTLDKGIWKLRKEQPDYQEITLDLICHQGKCESEIWGFAPDFNKDVDHQGTVTVTKTDNAWQLEVDLQIQSHPENPELIPATYSIEIATYRDRFIGSYQGEYQGRTLIGKVTGNKSDLQLRPLPKHQPIKAREHPRLIFRAAELPTLKEKAQTRHGKKIINNLKQTLQTEVYYDGYVPTGGYHAAGHCFVSLLEDDPQAAETAWQMVEKSMANPGERFLEHSPIVAGVALAYDLCYYQWDEKRQQQVTEWLALQTFKLIEGDSPKNGWNSFAWSNWNARARGAAGLAALAILGEPAEYYPQTEFFQEPENVEKLLKIAERNVTRYFERAIGDRGLGTEGDHYTTEPWRLTILPFLQAYRNVKGMDIAPSKTQWFLPHYITRSVPIDNELAIPSYGRHRLSPPPSLYGIGLPLVSEKFLPGVLWFLERYGPETENRSLGVSEDLPISAIYGLQGYPQNPQIKNPAKLWDKVLVDRQKGFYSFRNQWRDETDIVANIYVKQELLRASWAFPDAGSFRIAGLGHQWAIAGKSQARPKHENIVVTAQSDHQGAKPIYFQSSEDGSGTVTLKKENWLRSFAVDYSEASDTPGLFALVDRFEVSENADLQPKIWKMHVTGEVAIKDDSFTITSPSGATMQGTFISPQGVQLTYVTSAEGNKIQAEGTNDFFVVMTIQQDSPPPITVEGNGLNAKVIIGKQIIRFNGSNIVLENSRIP